MSDLQRIVEIIFQGTDAVSSELNKIGKKVDAFGEDMQDFGQPFADAAILVGSLITAIGGIGAAGVAASSDIETESKKMQLSLGLTNEEAGKFEEIAGRVYSSGVTSELSEAFDAVTDAQKKFGDNADVDIGKVSDAALKVRNIFDKDVSDTLTAVDSLMGNLGLTAEESYDFILSGLSGGLDTSGDFYDSINEYGTQFRELGFDAGEAYSVIETGIQGGGSLGTDKVLDLFKEFRIRMLEYSDNVQTALTTIGIDPDQFKKDLDSGQISFADAFGKIQKALDETTDKTDVFTSGVELMGTPFEDLGTIAVLEIDTTNTKIDEFQGKLDNFDPSTFTTKTLGAWNEIKLKFGDLDQWETVKDKLFGVFEDIAESFGPALESADFSGLEDAAQELWDDISTIFAENEIDITTVEGMKTAIGLVLDSITSILEVADGMVETFGPGVEAVLTVVDKFNDMEPGSKETAGNLIAVGTAIGIIGGLVSVGGSVLTGLGTIAGMFGAGGSLSSLTLAFGFGWMIGGELRKLFPLDEIVQEGLRKLDTVINFTGTMGDVDLGFDTKRVEDDLNTFFDS
ncbi:MAG: phage tail tape measure protein, partial [Desulfobacterium sp.]